ncbi:hypothetical protein OAV36_03680 [Flavobacteriales bacterium]|jgi:hypothetical protein|nr:hypothetical protein [Flavobacteriales bacterium]MDC3394956.1 hypothetical protein [Flavobacteriales bacterium]
MKKIYLILSVFAIVFTACETDFDVNAEWEETTVVYGLLDATDTDIEKKIQKIKISKAFLGKMDAMQMAQYADSINFDAGELDVKIVRTKNNGNTDTITLSEDLVSRAEGDFHDSIMVYTFENNSFLNSNSVYELLIKNKITGNKVSSKTNIVSGFDFDIRDDFPFGFIQTWIPGNPSATEFSSSTVRWEKSLDNGVLYQLDLIFNYTENDTVYKSLIYGTSVLESSDYFEFEGVKFFNFLKSELNEDPSIKRRFTNIDLLMTVGSEDLRTYRIVNEEITGIVQERPQFTNINNGIGLFSSRFTFQLKGMGIADDTDKFMKSTDGLDRNFH